MTGAGKTYTAAKAFDLQGVIYTFRYYAGWADKVHGKTIETTENKMAYTRHEPYGVVVCLRLSTSSLPPCAHVVS